MNDSSNTRELMQQMTAIQGLLEKIDKVGLADDPPEELKVSAAEFILEGLHAHKRIGRSEERVFTAGEKQAKKSERDYQAEEIAEQWEQRRRNRRPFN